MNDGQSGRFSVLVRDLRTLASLQLTEIAEETPRLAALMAAETPEELWESVPSDSPLTVEQQVTYLRGMLDEAFLLNPSPEEISSGEWAGRVRATIESAPGFIGDDAKGEVYSQTGVAEPE